MTRCLVGLAFLFLLAGCRTDVTVEVYSSDLRVVAEDKTFTTPGMMAIEIPAANNCDEYTPQIVEIMLGVVEKFTPQGCKRVGMESFLTAEIELPVLPSQKMWRATNALFGVVVEDRPQHMERVVEVTLNTDKHKSLNGRMRAKFHQKLDLSKSKVTVVLHNDERGTIKYRAAGVFVNGEPIAGRPTLTLNRRGRVRIELSNVQAAYLARRGAVGAFALTDQR